MSYDEIKFYQDLHQEKYRDVGESYEQAIERQAKMLSDNEDHYFKLKNILYNQRFLPGGRVQAAIGSVKNVTAYNCLHEDTEVLTKDGIYKIKDLNGKISDFLDFNGEWVSSQTNYFGKQDIYEVKLCRYKTKPFSVFATKNHDWVLLDGSKVTTEDLQPGTRIPHITPPKPDNSESYKLGLIHGLVYGDGTKTKSKYDKIGYHYRVCEDLNDIEHYLNDIPFSQPPSCKGDRLYYFYGDNIKTDYKRLPKTKNLEYILGFIRGWWFADGTISTQPEYILSCGKKEIDWLEKNGPMVGFFIRGYSKLPSESNFGKRKKELYNVRFDGRSIIIDDILKTRLRKRHKDFSKAWIVKSIKYSGVGHVYCPSVPTTASFTLSNGIHTGNCFVLRNVPDSMEGIMDVAKDAALTMKMGGGVGYYFGNIRPKGDEIKTLQSKASGPVSFMHIFDSVCKTIASAGNRRGAQMAVLPVWHPDIYEFVRCKHNNTDLTAFNISVSVTDEFMIAVENKEYFSLRFNDKVYQEIYAPDLWNLIMESTKDWAEPGILFIDRINEMNNLYYCETIYAVNPCAEQPLGENSACLLGSFNLPKYIINRNFDYDLFVSDIRTVVRAMDNVIDRTFYPLPEQEKQSKLKRRMGLGYTGLANTIETLGYSYGSLEFLEVQEKISKLLMEVAYETSALLAREKGAFPLFNIKYIKSKFIEKLPNRIIHLIGQFGIRNSHLISVAPTGTISLAAGNVSSGCEPVFAERVKRKVNTSDGQIEIELTDYALRNFGTVPKPTSKVTVDEHLAVLATAQKWTDSAISKTINCPADISWEDFKDIYMKAWKLGCKGVTTFCIGGKRFAIIEEKKEEKEPIACTFDPTTGNKTCG